MSLHVTKLPKLPMPLITSNCQIQWLILLFNLLRHIWYNWSLLPSSLKYFFSHLASLILLYSFLIIFQFLVQSHLSFSKLINTHTDFYPILLAYPFQCCLLVPPLEWQLQMISHLLQHLPWTSDLKSSCFSWMAVKHLKFNIPQSDRPSSKDLLHLQCSQSQ